MGGRQAWDFPASWDPRLVGKPWKHSARVSGLGSLTKILAGGFAMSAVLLVPQFPHQPRGSVGITCGCTIWRADGAGEDVGEDVGSAGCAPSMTL